MNRGKTCYKFKRLWQDYRQYRICYIIFVLTFIFILLSIKDITCDILLLFLGCSLMMFFVFKLSAHSKIHMGRDLDEIVMDANGISLVRKELTIKEIRWGDIDKIVCGRWGLDYGYVFTYLIWDKNGEQIWFHRGRKVKKYMLELYPPIKDMLPNKVSKWAGNEAHID